MRDIKFRAWEPDQKEIVYFDNEKASNDFYQVGHLLMLMANKHPKGENLLMQYTGLKDRNGVEIYEGDVVRIEDIISDIKGDVEVCVVEYAEGKSALLPRDTETNHRGGRYWHYWENLMWSEVIGNIHENPELLDA